MKSSDSFDEVVSILMMIIDKPKTLRLGKVPNLTEHILGVPPHTYHSKLSSNNPSEWLLPDTFIHTWLRSTLLVKIGILYYHPKVKSFGIQYPIMPYFFHHPSWKAIQVPVIKISVLKSSLTVIKLDSGSLTDSVSDV